VTIPQPTPPQEDASLMRGSILTAFVPGSIRFALGELANQESRSISSTTKCLLREALRARGVLRSVAGNDSR
jgi:hypothetical protein